MTDSTRNRNQNGLNGGVFAPKVKNMNTTTTLSVRAMEKKIKHYTFTSKSKPNVCRDLALRGCDATPSNVGCRCFHLKLVEVVNFKALLGMSTILITSGDSMQAVEV
ncbi:unnamed protein product [Ceratitis capitata]|uniref:(Mediterranean fruit fly) hypothetical protein n=1 Tax=Ceratitis capitata TaxID=7213 RepID=A0A811U4W1_CERCA|nr:unnamed protein product [Ceratitis capitata]